MKNTMLYCGAALMSIAMLQSCTKDELSNVSTVSGLQEMTFIAGTPLSRTSLQNGTTVWWTVGDAINIFSGSENNKFTTQDGGSSVATFTGKATPAESYTALYPYNADALIHEGSVITTLPSGQVAPVWGFDAKANISFATATDDNKSLTFQNTCGLIKFKNNLTDLKAITLTAEGVNIAGNVKIDNSGNLSVEQGSNAITLTANEGRFYGPGDNNPNAKEYSMVVPPVTFTGGFTLELTKSSGNETYTFSGENLTIVKGQIVTIELKAGGQPPVVEEQTIATVASAQEIVTDPTSGLDRVVLTMDKNIAGTFTDAVKGAFTVKVGEVTIPVSSGTVSGKNITLTLGDKIYSNDTQITVAYNDSYGVSDLTTTVEEGKVANIKIESAAVNLTHNTTWELNFANIAAAGDFYDPSSLEGVASVEEGGILNVTAPIASKIFISKEFKLRATANYKFECEYVTAGTPALTVRFADAVASSNLDIFKVWIKDGSSPAEKVSDSNEITADGKWYMKSQGDTKVSDAPTIGKFSIDNPSGGAQIKAIRLTETENRPDNRPDATFNGSHGEYTNSEVTWTQTQQ